MSRNALFQGVTDQSSFSFIRSECLSAIEKVQNEIDQKRAALQALIELNNKKVPVVEGAKSEDESKPLLSSDKTAAELTNASNLLQSDIEKLIAQKNNFSSMLANLDEMSKAIASFKGNEGSVSVTVDASSVNGEVTEASAISFSEKMVDSFNVMLNLMKLSAPAFLVFAHKDDHPSANILGPALMNGIILSGVLGSLLPYVGKYGTVSESTVALLKNISEKLAGKIAPSIAIMTSFLMLGQVTMAATLNFAVIAALITFSLPALVHLIAGEEMMKRFGLDRYGIAMKSIEICALSLFAYATAVGMKEDDCLKYQLVGVSMLLMDTLVGIGKHVKNSVSQRPSLEVEARHQLA